MARDNVERMSFLRWLAIIAGLMLFVSDYGFDAWSKPVPVQAYVLIGAVALGVDAPALRRVVLKFLESWAGGDKK